MKFKWYLQIWFIVIMFIAAIALANPIPAVIGIILFVMRFRTKQKRQNNNDTSINDAHQASDQNQERRETKSEKHKIAGTSYRINDILTLAVENDDYLLSKKDMINDFLYDKKIYQYEFFIHKTELIPEPDNPYDPNAIKVIMDGVHVGYIKKGSCAHVKNLMNSGTILSIKGSIYGGKYKYLAKTVELYGDEKPSDFELEKDETEYGALIEIITKQEE